MRISTSQQQLQTVQAMLEQQSRLARTQQQIASGQRILVPSDDPTGAKQMLDLGATIATAGQYQRTADVAEARLGAEGNALQSTTSLLQRVRELAVQANNDTLSAPDRKAIALEVRERLSELVGIANSQDANGEFLFGGYRATTQPFSVAPDGAVVYAGDQGQRQLQIGADRRIAVGDSGAAVFQAVRNGNGTFAIERGANTGTAIVGPGTVLDAATWRANPDQYSITFVTNGAGQLAYQITGAASGQVVPAPPAVAPTDAPAYASGAAIDFQGIQVTLTGTPAVGDTFRVAPSQQQDIFATVAALADALAAPATDPAARAAQHNDIGRALTDLDQALQHIAGVNAGVGGRLNALDSQRASNADELLRTRALLAQVGDLDYAQAITQLNQQQVALSAAQQAYLRVQGLSLFDRMG